MPKRIKGESATDEEEAYELSDEYLMENGMLFSCEAQYYAPDNDRGKTANILSCWQLLWKHPYHRRKKTLNDFKINNIHI